MKCPLCLCEEFEEFRGRKDARCVRCGSLERHRRAAGSLTMLGSPILGVALESCFRPMFSLCTVETLDKYKDGVDIRADLCDIPRPDESYNGIICFHVLEHIPDDRKALSEMARVLSPFGNAVIAVPIHGEKTEEWGEARPPDDHVRDYGNDFILRLEEFFEVRKKIGTGIYLCNKKIRRS